MAESLTRCLRDGALQGEHAPALSIRDSLHSPHGSHVFDHFVATLASHIAAEKSQARGLVLVAFNRSPSYYFELLTCRGLDASLLGKCVRILDCYSDPLGWKERIPPLKKSPPIAGKPSSSEDVTVFRNVKDLNKLLSSILDLGKGFVAQGKARYTVAIDLVSSMLRHASLVSVAELLTNLRSNDRISCIFWLIHSDLHEPRASTALEYLSTMVASVEPMTQYSDAKRSSTELVSFAENSYKAKFRVCLKRRNGRVKLLYEELHMEQSGIKFAAVSSENSVVNQNLLPKVQFNLQLSDKERIDRANVVLPFEHQGNGETIHIYDGRRSLPESQRGSNLMQPSMSSSTTETRVHSEKGEIHYVRDSDDERPDSDEDPDDDLDI